jgi:hypothetical protein
MVDNAGAGLKPMRIWPGRPYPLGADHLGPTLSMRGIDNAAYYAVRHHNRP